MKRSQDWQIAHMDEIIQCALTEPRLTLLAKYGLRPEVIPELYKEHVAIFLFEHASANEKVKRNLL